MCYLLCLMDNTDRESNALDNANKLGKLRLRLVRGMAIPLKNNNNFYWKWKRVEWNSLGIAILVAHEGMAIPSVKSIYIL